MNKNANMPLILVGGGGHCKAVIDVIEQLNLHIRGIIDTPEKVGKSVYGYKIIGTDDDIYRYAGNSKFVITLGAIGHPQARIRIYKYIEQAGGSFATLISPKAHVSEHAEIGDGSVIMNFANVSADVRVGRHCILNTACDVEHGSAVGDFCHISPGARINGDCKVGARSQIGSGAIITGGVSISCDSEVYPGALLTESITEPGVYGGNK